MFECGEKAGSMLTSRFVTSPAGLLVTRLPHISVHRSEASSITSPSTLDMQRSAGKADAFPDIALTGLPGSQQPPALSPHALQSPGLGSAVDPPCWSLDSAVLDVTVRRHREV